ncbi:MAG: aroB [Holophagaceae bacterium]|nr:aroB [Holophagaceae bacterium]
MMEHTLTAPTGTCRILTDARLEDLKTLAQGRRVVVVTDANVFAAQGHRLEGFDVIQIGLGETNKTLATVEGLYEAFLARELDRSSLVIGVGGGIVCDIVGFAASTYMRGLRFGFAPTTLLAQVDAAIGGKNGVNFHRYKNMVGVIRQPAFVLVDPTTLSTLPIREIRCGLAEVVKSAAIADRELFEWLELEGERVEALEPEALARAAAGAVAVKARIVQEDEEEKGVRMLLNLGHTLGHALEQTLAPGSVTHGEAVSLGMVAAARLSVQKAGLSAQDAARIPRLLKRLGLPVEVTTEQVRTALQSIRQDKKRRGNQIHWILLEAIGQGSICPLDLTDTEKLLLGEGE